MYQLVIAEKPSVAMSIAKVLGATARKEGHMEGGGWLVSWCVGHLAELAEPAAYDPRYGKWRREDLPILPESWRFTVGQEKRSQFDTLRTLLRREDVSEVVNACDAGREGELIFRTAYHLAGCAKPMKRLWISSMEDGAIREGFASLRPGRDYDGLHQAALCRQKADWLVGINATRLFSVLYNRTLNIGRVMSPTLALIVQREAEIAAFAPEPFYTVELDCGGMTVTGERISVKKDASALAAACEGHAATIQTAERREKSEKPPALYDLTTLQREANRALGYTAQQTLDYLQALYEKKLCTYPRTDSRYLTDDMENTVPALVSAAAVVCGLDAPGEVLASQVCNSGKVTDHHAVVPTRSAAAADLSALPLGEREVLRLVSLALLRAVCPPYRYAETAVVVECAGHSFSAKGKVLLDAGWRAYAELPQDAALPGGLTEGMQLPVEAVRVKTGKTAPPKHFTEDSILASMETAGAGDMPEDAERRGIGTPATRAAILEKLVASGLVERKKAKKITNLLPTQAGSSLVTVLPEALQSPLLTAEWEQRLGEVERGTLAPEDFMDGIAALVRDLVRDYQPVSGWEVLFPPDRETVGPCPRCGGAVTESKKGFFCENRECRFVLWKDSKFFSAKKKQLTKSAAASLLKAGRVKLTGCWSEKTGKTYDATVILEDDGERTNYKLVFGHE
uniref:DNA topoisomerase III n=1 Tax=uncultured Oscillibacter sp. TaxID=876091 RepID=UPI002729F8AD|nr:DNA topoisomerase III [uncultured Oscillibacter sp.]